MREIPRSFAASCRYSISKGITSSGSAIPRLNGAGSLSRSDLIRNSFGASPKSQIAVPPKVGIAGAIAVGLRAQSRLPGTEFLDAETKRQKSPLKCANAYRYLNPGSEWPENPRGNALFSAVPETCSLQRLDGGGDRARTGDPPPSHRTSLRPTPGTEISNAETGRRKPVHHLAETESETRRERESPISAL